MSRSLLLEQGFEHYKRKEFEKAEVRFREVLDSCVTDDPDLKFRLAFCLEMQGNFEEAESYYRQAGISNGPPAVVGNALFRIAWIAMNLRDHEKAVAYFRKAGEFLKKSPDSHHIYKEAIYWMALGYEVLGQSIKALGIYEKISEDDFWIWDVFNRKIKCFDKIGRYEEALACCLEFEEHYKKNSDSKRAGEIYPGIKNIMEQLEKLLSDTP